MTGYWDTVLASIVIQFLVFTCLILRSRPTRSTPCVCATTAARPATATAASSPSRARTAPPSPSRPAPSGEGRGSCERFKIYRYKFFRSRMINPINQFNFSFAWLLFQGFAGNPWAGDPADLLSTYLSIFIYLTYISIPASMERTQPVGRCPS